MRRCGGERLHDEIAALPGVECAAPRLEALA
jgi:hypothetical protein